jgi:hypothetical protein
MRKLGSQSSEVFGTLLVVAALRDRYHLQSKLPLKEREDLLFCNLAESLSSMLYRQDRGATRASVPTFAFVKKQLMQFKMVVVSKVSAGSISALAILLIREFMFDPK